MSSKSKFAIIAFEDGCTTENGGITPDFCWSFIGWRMEYYDVINREDLWSTDEDFEEEGVALYVEDTLENAFEEARCAQSEFDQPVKVLELVQDEENLGCWLPFKLYDVPEKG